MLKKICITFTALLLSASAAERILYDGGAGLSPADQGWTLLATPLPPPFGSGNSVFESVGSGDVTLDTTVAITDSGGYFSNFLAPSVVLDRQVGFTLKWASELSFEMHNTTDRAGYSVLIVTSDLMALELGMWLDQIWAQNDQPLFTHGEGVALNTEPLIAYELMVLGDTYELRVGGALMLSGNLRDYSAFDHVAAGLPLDPYETPNMIFFGDDTSSASANFRLQQIGLVTPEPLVYDDTGNVNDLILRLNSAGDTIEVTDADFNILSSSPLSETLSVTINGLAGDDILVVDFASGSPIPAGGLTYNGGSQDVADTLSIVNGAFGPVVVNGLNGSDGEIDLDGPIITFTGLEPVDMTGSTATDFTLNMPASDDLIVWSLLGGATNRVASGDAPPTFESTDFLRPSGPGTLNFDGGLGVDTLWLTNDVPNGRLNITVESVIVAGNLPFNTGMMIADTLLINPTNTLTSETMVIGNNAVALISGNVVLGGNESVNDFKGNFTQNTGSRMVIGGDLIFGGSTNAGVEGGSYTLNAGELVVTGSVVETTASVDSAQFILNTGTADIGGDITVQRFGIAQNVTGNFHYNIASNQAVRTTGTLSVGDGGIGELTLSNEGATLDTINALVGEDAGSSGTVNIENGRVWNVQQFLRIGHNGTGVVNLVSGTINGNSIDGNPRGIRIAENAGSDGTLVMGLPGGSGSADPVLNNYNVNFETSDQGIGRVIMHHGTVNQLNGGNIILAQVAGSEGTFTMMDGLVNVPAASLRVGNNSTGTFEQVGGEVVVGATIDLGNSGTAIGNYHMQDGSIRTLNMTVGNVAKGTFIQDGGQIQVGSNLVVGNNAASQGSYVMNGGSLSSSNSTTVGVSGVGSFTQNAGTVDVQNELFLGSATGGMGDYLMNGGNLITTNRLLIGSNADGRMTLNQGVLNVGTALVVGNALGGTGEFVMTNGVLTVGARAPSIMVIGNGNTNTTTGIVRFEGGTVNLSRSIRIADNGSDSSGTLIIGTPDGSNSPVINMQLVSGDNFEMADNGTGLVQFHSGLINMNDNNLITGQALGSTATATIGGGAAEARLEMTGGNGLRDWNVNGGHGIVSILTNGIVHVGRNLNMGNNTNATCGLELTIDGGTLRLGATSTQVGDLNFRAGGPLDQIDLMDGWLISNGGAFNLVGSTTTNFAFTGGVLANFSAFINGALTQDGGMLRIGDTNIVRDFTITGGNDYTQNAGILEIDIAGAGGAGVSNGHDRVVLNGVLTLAGSLVLNSPYTASVGETFEIITVNGGNAIVGVFDGLPEGATVTAGASAYTISYAGGTGNDVVLSSIELPPEITAQQPIREPGGVRLSFVGLPNTTYTIQYTSKDLPLNWQDISTQVSGPDGSFEFSRVPLTDTEFYRAIR
ncbi:MAG: T5SS/PEP-CTERM-associated repeat protein [Kiritimatiellia bacterium]|jgi:T5SS/PEP-CTERM-associated repeat protein